MRRQQTGTGNLMALLCFAITLSVQPICSVHASDSVDSDANTGNSADPNNNAEVSTIDGADANNNTEVGIIDSVDADEIADSSDFFSEEYFYSDLPIVFTATRLPQPISKTPVAMTIINKEMIESSGATEIPELMRLVPGMQVANIGGDKYIVTYHGRSDRWSRSLQVLVDGRPIYNVMNGGVSWSDLPLTLEDINRIEVIRGSNAAAYGSNSFAGVINIITDHPSDQTGTLIRTTFSDKLTREVMARNAGSVGDLDYRLTLNYEEGDGLKSRNDDYTSKYLSFRGDYQLDSRTKLMFQAGYSRGTQQEGFSGDLILIPRDTDFISHFQQIKWTHTIDQDSEYSLHFYHNHKQVNDVYIFNHPKGGPVNPLINGFFDHDSDRYELEFEHSLKPISDLRLVWGAGLRHDNTKSPLTLNTESNAIRNQVHAFINSEWKPSEKLTVNIGAMLEKYEGFSSLFSPRVALNYSPYDGHTFRIARSRAYRMPMIYEEQVDLLVKSNGGLPIDLVYKTLNAPDPEEINSIELGYLAELKSIPLTLDAKLFIGKINPTINYADDEYINCDVACLADNGEVGTFRNDGNVKINGFELQADFKVTPKTHIHAVYSHLNATGWQIKDYNREGDPPNEYFDLRLWDVSKLVPTKTYGILASHKFGNGIKISGGLHHTSKMTWLEDGNDVDAYNKWDLRIAKKFKFSDATIDVAAILHNITDDDYQEYYNGNQAQREFHLQIGVKF